MRGLSAVVCTLLLMMFVQESITDAAVLTQVQVTIMTINSNIVDYPRSLNCSLMTNAEMECIDSTISPLHILQCNNETSVTFCDTTLPHSVNVTVE